MASINVSCWLPHYQKYSLNNSISWLVSVASRRFMSRNQGLVFGPGSWWSILAFLGSTWEQVCPGLLWYGKSRSEYCHKNTVGLKNRARQWGCNLRWSPRSASIKQKKLNYDTFSSAVITCTGNPCTNGGSCEYQGNEEFSCNCPLGYSGRHCEIGKFC